MTCETCSCTTKATTGEPAERAARSWLTTAQAADLVGVKTVTICTWCERGLLGSKFGPGRGRWRILRSDLERVAGKEWVPADGRRAK